MPVCSLAFCPPSPKTGSNETWKAAVSDSRDGELSAAVSKAVPILGLVLLLEKIILFKPLYFGVSVKKWFNIAQFTIPCFYRGTLDVISSKDNLIPFTD